jgi:hypothetical protein
LAAERGGSLGLLVRPARVRDEPCWAAVRLAVATVPVVLPPGRAASSVGRRLRVEWVRGSGVVAGKTIEWELGHETSTVSRLSVPRASRRA